MYDQYVELRKSRPFSDVLSAVFDLLKASALPLVKTVAYISGPYALVASVAMALSTSDVVGLQTDITSGDLSLFEYMDMGLPYYLGTILLLAAYGILASSVFSFYRFYVREKRTPSVDEVRSEMSGKLGMVFGTYVVAYLLIIFGFLILIIPGIFLLVPFSILVVIRMNEGLALGPAMGDLCGSPCSGWAGETHC